MLLAYASRFVSLLLEELEDKVQEVDQIILYGSVARGTATEESDVDIFVDTEEDLEDKVDSILEKFYDSREYTLFKSKGIDNEISVKVGELEKWEELHRSITSTGKVLWGDFKARETPIGTEHKLLIYWEGVGKSRTSFLNKLYGYKTKDREVKGLLGKVDGKKTGKSSIIVPFKHRDRVFELFEKYNVDARSVEVFSVE